VLLATSLKMLGVPTNAVLGIAGGIAAAITVVVLARRWGATMPGLAARRRLDPVPARTS
jgi:hypothetical protein